MWSCALYVSLIEDQQQWTLRFLRPETVWDIVRTWPLFSGRYFIPHNILRILYILEVMAIAILLLVLVRDKEWTAAWEGPEWCFFRTGSGLGLKIPPTWVLPFSKYDSVSRNTISWNLVFFIYKIFGLLFHKMIMWGRLEYCVSNWHS